MRTYSIVLVVAACSGSSKQTNLPTSPPSPVVTPSTPSALEPPQPTLRLPKNFVPTAYHAQLSIDPSAKGFDGTIVIDGKVSERSSVIWLHGYKLAVKHATAGSIPLTATPHGEDLIELRAQSPIDAGNVSLTIDYSGIYDDVNTAGAFRQRVNDQNYIFTQFEALYARRVFPCVDEPDNKVPWQLTLDVPDKLVAVSNTPVAHEQPAQKGMKRIEFGITKPLPSYLIAFGVGPFEIVDAGKTKSGTPVRIVTLAGRAAEADWAAKTSARIIDLEEEFFGSKYPYEKMDMLTIPVTVGFGAMENAGLITYTETLMLMDPKRPAKDRQYTWVVVAAHELAHQWFGDLVTMKYWDDIWLNEGFANWTERKVSAKFDPSWHDELAELDVRSKALGADSLVSARQIRQPIETEGDVLNAFDGITYDKGASVLNMFEHYVGTDAFLTGVRQYLADHAFGNATSTDFAQAISKSSGKDVNAAFASFLEQPGAPEITATLACDKGQPPRVELTQKRYVPAGAATATAGKPWIVPVCVAYDASGKRAEACGMLDQPTGSIALQGKCPRWVMPNVDGRGYYRNAYPTTQVVALRDEAWPQLKWTERRDLFLNVSDAASQAKMPFALALSFVPKMLTGADRFTTESAVHLPTSVDRFVPDDLRTKYEYWLRQVFGPGAQKVGLVAKDTESLDAETSRDELVNAVVRIGRDPQLVAEAVKLAEHYRDLPQAVRQPVLAIAVDNSPEMFDRVLKDVQAEPDRTRRGEMLQALGAVRDPQHQAKALQLLLDNKLDIRETLFMTFVAHYDQNRVEAADFFKAHMDALMKRLPDQGTVGSLARLGHIFTAICQAPKRDEVADYVNKTFAKMAGGERVVRQEIEEMDQCIAKRKLLEPELRAWLQGIKVQKPK